MAAAPKTEDSPSSLLLYEVCSAGPVAIYYTEERETADVDRSSEREPGTSLAFQIYHGWKPLLLSTAYCFSRIICQSLAPVIISGPVDVMLMGANIRVYLLAQCKVFRKIANKDKVEELEVASRRVPSSGMVNIFAASMNKFGDSIEAWISDGMTVYCEGGQEIRYASWATGTITRVGWKEKK